LFCSIRIVPFELALGIVNLLFAPKKQAVQAGVSAGGGYESKDSQSECDLLRQSSNGQVQNRLKRYLLRQISNCQLQKRV